MKNHTNIFSFMTLYKTLIGPIPLRIRFNKEDGFIRICDGTRYLKFFGSEKYDAISNRIRYLVSLKNSLIYVFSHNYAKIKVDSYDLLPTEKPLTLHNIIILIKSVLNKDQNHYYYNIFLKQCLCQLAKFFLLV